MENILHYVESEIIKMRDNLFYAVPSGEVDSFTLIKIIKKHLEQIDILISHLDESPAIPQQGISAVDFVIKAGKDFKNNRQNFEFLSISSLSAFLEAFAASPKEYTREQIEEKCQCHPHLNLSVGTCTTCGKELPGGLLVKDDSKGKEEKKKETLICGVCGFKTTDQYDMEAHEYKYHGTHR